MTTASYHRKIPELGETKVSFVSSFTSYASSNAIEEGINEKSIASVNTIEVTRLNDFFIKKPPF